MFIFNQPICHSLFYHCSLLTPVHWCTTRERDKRKLRNIEKFYEEYLAVVKPLTARDLQEVLNAEEKAKVGKVDKEADNEMSFRR